VGAFGSAAKRMQRAPSATLCAALLEASLRMQRRGLTTDLKQRLAEHNSGKSPHTAQFEPWRLVTYVAFSDEQKAAEFERYLKSGSGHAFANRRLW